jgi:hypothetical protein
MGSLDMLGNEEMKSPTRSQETVLFSSLYNLSRPWGLWSKHKKKDKMLVG